jgi:hypothetical protein
VCGPATRMTLTMHFALKNNTADLSAKDESQETIVRLIGILGGFIMLSYLPKEPSLTLIWLLYFIFTFLHLLCNYLAVSSCALRSFNDQRIRVIVKLWMDSKLSKIPSPMQVARHESILSPLFSQHSRIDVGCEIDQESIQLAEKRSDCSILILGKSNRHHRMYLEEYATDLEILVAYFAIILVQEHEFVFEKAQALVEEHDLLELLSRHGWTCHANDLGSQMYSFSH